MSFSDPGIFGVEDGKHHMNKDKEDDHWEWVTCGVIPVGEKRKLGIPKDA